MRILVTGAAGHLGEALMRRLPELGHEPRGLDLLGGPFVDIIGSITDPAVVREAIDGADAVIHAATLHKPHVGSHSRAEFVTTNVHGTLALLEEAARARVSAFVFTSTTSAFGRALTAPAGEAATWITEDVVPRPKNIYGATKCAAEDLCELVHRDTGLPVVVLRTSRFFPEADDLPERTARFASDEHLKTVELLHRRADLEDLVTAHLRAVERAPELGFGRYVVTATTPFLPGDAARLATDAGAVMRERCAPETAGVFADRGWTFPGGLDRVYDNTRARRDLRWEPIHSFDHAIRALASGRDPRSAVARAVTAKGYHAVPTGVYTPAGAPRTRQRAS